MYVNIAIHTPNAGHEQDLIESMHRYSAAARSCEGLEHVSTLRDNQSGRLFGLAIWRSEEDAQAARPTLMEAVKDDDFETWVAEHDGYRLEEV